jgi:hypothetical protein
MDSGNSLTGPATGNLQVDDATDVVGFTFVSGSTNQLTPDFTGKIQVSAALSLTNHRTDIRIIISDGTKTKNIAQIDGQVTGSDPAAELAQVSGSCVFKVTKGVPLSFKYEVTSATSTSGTPGEDLYIDVVRIATTSSRGVSFPFPNGTIKFDTGGATPHGTTNTKVRKFDNVTANTLWGSVTNTAALGTFITITEDGVYGMSWSDGRVAASAAFMGFIKNGDGTVNASSQSSAILMPSHAHGSSLLANMGTTEKLKKGDIITPHDNGELDMTGGFETFVMTQVYKLG